MTTRKIKNNNLATNSNSNSNFDFNASSSSSSSSYSYPPFYSPNNMITVTPSPSTLLTSSATAIEEEFLLSRKIEIAADGLIDYFTTQLNKLKIKSNENTLTICDYNAALVNEVNPVSFYKRTQIQIVCYLSEFHNNTKPFAKMTRNNILSY